MSRWRSVWLVARREILERGRSRGFILSVAVHDRHRRSARSSCRPSCSATTRRRRSGVVEPAPAGLDGRPSSRPRSSSTRTSRSSTYPDARGGRRRPRGRRGRGRRRRPGRPVARRATIRFKEETDQGIAQIIVGAPSIEPARAGRPRPAATSTRPRWRPRSSRRRSTALDPQTDADRARFLVANIGAVLILVGIFSFGFTVLTGVVEEKQSRVVEVVLVDRPRPRPADGQGPRHRRPRARPAGRLRRRGARRGAPRDRPVHAADHDARRRSCCSRSGSSSATRCTRRRSASSARSRRGWRRPRTPRRRSRWSR